MRAHAVLLDVTHRLLLRGGAPFAVEVPRGGRPLQALEAAAGEQLGRELGVSLGGRVAGDDAWFVYVDSTRGGDGAGGEWVALGRWAAEHAGPWALYVDAMLGGWWPPTTELEVFYFGNEPKLASQLAHHVVKGTKRATTSWAAVAEHDGGAVAVPGMVSIVTDGFGIPLCAIETTRVERGRFGDAGAEIAAAEGEGDGSLADWREAHQGYFAAESGRIGVPFTDDAVMDHEHFRVLRVFQGAA
ncbi:MAG TPA: ASCH domain-containing protein [Kofleriaceae bacterium]